MTRPIVQAVLDTRLVDDVTLTELRKWKMLQDVEEPSGTFDTPEAVGSHLVEAMEGEEQVETRDTDLNMFQHYTDTKQPAKLHVPDPGHKTNTVPISIHFCRTKMGEYVIPWTSESIWDLMLDERTYLKPPGEPRVRFSDMRELFYDDKKVFIVCTPTGSTK